MGISCSPQTAIALNRWFKGDTERFQPRKNTKTLRPESRILLEMKDKHPNSLIVNRLYRVLMLDMKDRQSKDYQALIRTLHVSTGSYFRFSSFSQLREQTEYFYRNRRPDQKDKHGVIVSLDLRAFYSDPVVFSWKSALIATRSYPTIHQNILFNGKLLKEFVLFFDEAPLLRIDRIIVPNS